MGTKKKLLELVGEKMLVKIKLSGKQINEPTK